MASAAAWRLSHSGFFSIFMMEIAAPLAVRRGVSFCEAVYDGSQVVEGVEALRAENPVRFHSIWSTGKIAVTVDPSWNALSALRPDVLVDAVLAKKNLGTCMGEAQLVIGLGPGFVAGEDVHFVIETQRGHNLGRILSTGEAESNTGVPGPVAGITVERVLRAPAAGEFASSRRIGERVERGEVIGRVGGIEITARIDGVLRGLIRPGTWVSSGLKIGDIDPRGIVSHCYTISDKARAIAGSVLEAVLRTYNR